MRHTYKGLLIVFLGVALVGSVAATTDAQTLRGDRLDARSDRLTSVSSATERSDERLARPSDLTTSGTALPTEERQTERRPGRHSQQTRSEMVSDPTPTQSSTDPQPTNPTDSTDDEEVTDEAVDPTPEPPLEEESAEPSSSYLDAIAAEVHRLTNAERAAAGVPTLQVDARLAAVATGHSEDMAARDYFSHDSPEGCNAGCRLEQAGYEYQAWGENIAWRESSNLPSAAALAEHFVSAWMNSPGHRANILKSDFTHEGIGLALDGTRVYITANFSDPR